MSNNLDISLRQVAGFAFSEEDTSNEGEVCRWQGTDSRGDGLGYRKRLNSRLKRQEKPMKKNKTNIRPAVALKLAALLESGKISKAIGYLRFDQDGKKCMCLEGAICELYRITQKKGRWVRSHAYAESVWEFTVGKNKDAVRFGAPDEVKKWATGGDRDSCGIRLDGKPLIRLNDSHDLSFSAAALRLRNAVKSMKKKKA